MNLDEIDKFLKKYNLPKLTDEIKDLNSLISNKETSNKNLPTKKTQTQMVSLINASKYLKKTVASML